MGPTENTGALLEILSKVKTALIDSCWTLHKLPTSEFQCQIALHSFQGIMSLGRWIFDNAKNQVESKKQCEIRN